eukprot:207605-Pelagomonas_calceolata.AAC.2
MSRNSAFDKDCSTYWLMWNKPMQPSIHVRAKGGSPIRNSAFDKDCSTHWLMWDISLCSPQYMSGPKGDHPLGTVHLTRTVQHTG